MNKSTRIILLFLFALFFANPNVYALIAKKDSVTLFKFSPTYNKARTIGFTSVTGTAMAASFVGLNQLWYKDYPREAFHLFDDNKEWLQMDKIGHSFSTYKLGKISVYMLRWSGVDNKKAIWYGSFAGSFYLLGIEIMDGFSSGWGFSLGDFAANTIGSAMVLSQNLLWNETKVEIKYSYKTSTYAQYRPNLLGSTRLEQMFKDYNAQNYWLSFGPANLIKGETKFPKWINVAIGYGANGMIGGHENPLIDAKTGLAYPTFERYRQVYLGLDINLAKIKTKYKTLNSALALFGFLKIPMPALEYNKIDGLKFHPLFF
ncbi:MAG: DUF2279 domain-containing protein [Bacteroidota bacterium]